MQYHRNGFRAGDPDILAPGPRVHDRSAGLPPAVDVLIAGCGPAGLCLAAQLALEPGIHTMIVEPKLGPIEKGQADGISVRSMEMFGAFGFAEKISREAVWINETTFWTPGGAGIQRVARVQDVPDGMSEMPHVLINQARIHDMYLDIMKNSPTRLVPDYGLKVADLVVGTEGEYPVTVTLEHTAPGREGETEVVRAKYVVGCDGARSSVRRAIGGALHGDAAHHAWGVIDLLAVTDFPDWRMKAFVRSEAEGTLMVLPREGGHLVRLYVELDRLGEDERAADRGMDDSHIIAKAQRIFAPYKLEVKEVVWWSIYEVGHRLTDKFDDVPAGEVATRAPRVMLAGDACHTHSPKAGQGMNVSMQDGFNLGWKLGSVLTGRSPETLLATYGAERKPVAQQLIDFDREWSSLMARKPEEISDPQELATFYLGTAEFPSGFMTQYTSSMITGTDAHQALAAGFPLGKRFKSAEVTRVCDGNVIHLGHHARADGRWRVYAFGDASGERLNAWAAQAAPVFARFTPAEADVDSVFDVKAIHQGSYEDVEVTTVPELFAPKTGPLGLTDWEKVYASAPSKWNDTDIFEARELSRDGVVVVVRPDQYVAAILPLDAVDELASFFEGALLPAS